jgi:hypothetical protein
MMKKDILSPLNHGSRSMEMKSFAMRFCYSSIQISFFTKLIKLNQQKNLNSNTTNNCSASRKTINQSAIVMESSTEITDSTPTGVSFFKPKKKGANLRKRDYEQGQQQQQQQEQQQEDTNEDGAVHVNKRAKSSSMGTVVTSKNREDNIRDELLNYRSSGKEVRHRSSDDSFVFLSIFAFVLEAEASMCVFNLILFNSVYHNSHFSSFHCTVCYTTRCRCHEYIGNRNVGRR